MRSSLRLLALAAPLLVAALLAVTLVPATEAQGRPADRSGEPALGSPAHLAPVAQGWGRPHPRHVFNGGDPSGQVVHLSWRRWGAPAATGRGDTWLLRPGGGYYARPGRIVLRASGLGRCPDGTVAYTRLDYRVAHRPGGRVGRSWHPWAGTGDVC